MNQHVAPAKKLTGTLHLPPDKSIAQRAALFSMLSEERSVIANYPAAEDPQTALRCIALLGATVSKKEFEVTVDGVGRDALRPDPGTVDCGNSGTVMRLLSGIIAGAGITATLTGDASLAGRPMKRIVDPLVRMGAAMDTAHGGYPPLRISRKDPLRPILFELPVASAQLKSCVLLAGLFGDTPTRVVESVPSRNHTETMLRLPVSPENGKNVIESSRDLAIPPQNLRIPGDFSAAAFWMVAASILEGSDLLLPATGINPTRCAALHILERMGADIETSNERLEGDEPVADIRVRAANLKGVDIHPEEIPNAIDELPVLSVAMAFAEGRSRITGASELRYKESDRLREMQNMLERAGVKIIGYDDGLAIDGNPGQFAKAAVHDSRHDHRMAMSAAILSLRGDGVSEIRNAEAAAVSYPDFWSDLDSVAHV
ncbi:3-phosphoshikimate 1-carboxyvinyltransferase [Balneolales bacterium ANBcel1]|nr:3-phosphoshikimate 1-carboxyvinyltransferase [Balneolales bacterium ANBcel1]